MAEIVAAAGGTAGEAFRLLSIGFAAFVIGVWITIVVWQWRSHRRWRDLDATETLLGSALAAFVVGFLAIQIEAVFLNPQAILLWGNFAFPVGMALMLAGLLQVIARHAAVVSHRHGPVSDWPRDLRAASLVVLLFLACSALTVYAVAAHYRDSKRLARLERTTTTLGGIVCDPKRTLVPRAHKERCAQLNRDAA